MLTRLAAVIISQYIEILNYYIVCVELILYVNYISIKEAAAAEEEGEGEGGMDVHLSQACATSSSGDRIYFRANLEFRSKYYLKVIVWSIIISERESQHLSLPCSVSITPGQDRMKKVGSQKEDTSLLHGRQ